MFWENKNENKLNIKADGTFGLYSSADVSHFLASLGLQGDISLTDEDMFVSCKFH